MIKMGKMRENKAGIKVRKKIRNCVVENADLKRDMEGSWISFDLFQVSLWP